jgi:lysophospholipase L1-like esterase
MPLEEYSFLYNFETFDSIKKNLFRESFFDIVDAHHTAIKTKRTDKKEYTHFLYFDDLDKKGYELYKDFVYTVNSNNFRNEHFTELSNKNYNVLALGCSYAFGIGLPEQFSWPRILESYIKDKKDDVKVVNLGSPGLGVDSIINNLISFISKYGAPDAIFALFPDMNRHVIFHPRDNNFIQYAPTTKNIKDKNSDPYIFSKARSYAFEDRMYSSVNQIRMLEELCKAYNIKLFWNSWSGVDADIYAELKFNNFCPFYDYSFREEEVYLTIPEKFKKYWDSARDVNHPGIKYMSNVAKMFFTRWNKVYENF